MLRTTLAGLRAHKARLAMSALAIVLGVGFLAGVITFTGAIRTAFFDQFAAQARHVDAAVRPPRDDRPKDGGRTGPVVPASVYDAVRRVPGAVSVEGRLAGSAPLLDRRGRPVTDGDATGVALDVPLDPRFRDFTLKSGRLPAAAGEALVDTDTAAQQRLRPGDTVTVLDAGRHRRRIRLVGTMDIGVRRDLNGLSVLALQPDAVRRLTGVSGYSRVDVAAAPGLSQDALRALVARAAGPGYGVVTGRRLAHDLAEQDLRQTDLIMRGLLLFAFVALAVAAIVIYNTFTILLTHRLRELALLRCVGATRRQVFGGVLTEALAVGVLGSALGVAAGTGIAAAMRWLFDAAGAGLPAAGVAPSAPAALAGMAVGTITTCAAALVPAWSATRIPPVAALRAQPAGQGHGGVRGRVARAAAATVLGAGGIALTAAGIPRGEPGLFVVAAGGGLFFLAVLAAAPLFVGPLAAALARPPGRLLGVPTRLAAANARRSPGRTAATTMTLTIGVGLMTLFSVVAATAGHYAGTELDRHYPVDYIIEPMAGGTGGRATISPSVAGRLRDQPQVAAAVEVRDHTARVNGTALHVVAVDPAGYGAGYRPRMASGSADALRTGTGGIALLRGAANRLGVRAGDTVAVALPAHRTLSLRVVGVFTSRFAGEEAIVSWRDFTAGFGPGGDAEVLVKARPGVAAPASRAAVDGSLGADTLLRVTSIASYKSRLNSALDQVLALVAAMLGVAIIIALFGIANTLSLSVIERTRELALLRALGLTRRQLRRMLSQEALLIGLMGGLIGSAIGAGFGWAVGETFIRAAGGGSGVAYPIGRIGLYVALAALAGVVAAVFPARRAARASVISALTDP
ncbi:MAG TPA: FtsX-like permease family protein [Streptosporangiaceae bacterium]